MSAIGIAIVLLAVCWLLGGAKRAMKRPHMRKPHGESFRCSVPVRHDTELCGSNMALARRAQAEKDCRKQLKEIGHDLVRIADCCDSSTSDPCRAWHGRIISAFGKVPGFLTLADLDIETIFGGELGHRLDYVDETVDAKEIARQKR